MKEKEIIQRNIHEVSSRLERMDYNKQGEIAKDDPESDVGSRKRVVTFSCPQWGDTDGFCEGGWQKLNSSFLGAVSNQKENWH